MPTVHSKATKHRLALSAAQFALVCGFRKVDRHVFRANNTISVTAQRTIIRKGGPYGQTVFDEFHNCKSESTIIAKFYQDIRKQGLNKILIFFNATDKRDSVTSDRIYKIEDAVYQSIGKLISSIKGDFLPYFQSCLYILEKEGLNELEASRRVIFNCFEMQAIASYPALATLKAAQFKTYGSCKVKRFTLNSVKDLFTNLSKDYFLSITAEDIAKAANTLLPLKEVCAKILIESYKLIVQAVTWLGLREKFGNESVLVMQGVALIAFAEAIILTEATHVVIIEPQDSIVYFNLDSELELKVLGKQDVKTTSQDKL
ncbi:hypothetical protein HBI83_073330 [Parastagonospora nodorum]|nr:hypothetical protein HBI83_073330 [Parastagonospora nodorum]